MATPIFRHIKVFYLCFLIQFVSGQDWEHQLVLTDEYHVQWFVKDNSITFQVEVATKGWVGFGMSTNGGMPGSDVVIGWIKDERTEFQDRHAKGKYLPVIDDKQNWFLLWSHENDTHTILRFNRSLSTCDEDDLPITEETTRLIYAYNPNDPDSTDSVMYHGPTRRGARSVLLLKRDALPNRVRDPDMQEFHATAQNAHIPNQNDTIYHCTFIKAPKLDRKHHIIRVEPVIQPGNERFVHHMILYKCSNVSEDKILPYVGKPYQECYTKEQVPNFYFCLEVTAAWAIGGQEFNFPEDAGTEIGEPGLSYFLLETHYDNPGLETAIDNSGLKLIYTSNLRRYDSSVIVSGTLSFACMFVPPRQKEFKISGHSHPACLRKKLPKDGIKAFAVILHSHLIGKRITVRHFRGKEELKPLSADKYYDFNLQEIRPLSVERLILPNDHIITECIFDSSGRNLTTFGGLSSLDEMCLSLIFYYPKVALSFSLSCPSPHNVMKAIGVNEISDDDRYVISPITGLRENYIDFLDNFPWNHTSVKAAERAMVYSPHLNVCLDGSNKLELVYVFAKYPKIQKRYEEKDFCSKRQI